jgi:hypothetical protein
MRILKREMIDFPGDDDPYRYTGIIRPHCILPCDGMLQLSLVTYFSESEKVEFESYQVVCIFCDFHYRLSPRVPRDECWEFNLIPYLNNYNQWYKNQIATIKIQEGLNILLNIETEFTELDKKINSVSFSAERGIETLKDRVELNNKKFESVSGQFRHIQQNFEHGLEKCDKTVDNRVEAKTCSVIEDLITKKITLDQLKKLGHSE